MTPTVITVLKIIGIVLLVIIAVVLVIALLLLFFPVTHKLCAVRTEKEGDPPVLITFKLSWLFGVIRANGVWDGSLRIKAKALFFTVYSKPPEEEEKMEADKNESAPAVLDEIEDISDEPVVEEELGGVEIYEPDAGAQDTGTSAPESGETAVGSGEEFDDSGAEKDGSGEFPGSDGYDFDSFDWEEEDARGNGFIQYLKDLPDIVKRLFCTLERACDNILKVPGYIEYYLMLIQAERTHRAMDKAVRRSMRILRQLLPRRWKMDLAYGGGDPASTGLAVEAASMLYPITAGHLNSVWDYDNKVFTFDLTARGHIILFVLLINGFRIYKDKDINITWKRFKREK